MGGGRQTALTGINREVKPSAVLSMWALERDSAGFESGLCHLSVVGSSQGEMS